MAGWGFSCLVETPDKKILFDVGVDRMIEMFNIELHRRAGHGAFCASLRG